MGVLTVRNVQMGVLTVIWCDPSCVLMRVLQRAEEQVLATSTPTSTPEVLIPPQGGSHAPLTAFATSRVSQGLVMLESRFGPVVALELGKFYVRVLELSPVLPGLRILRSRPTLGHPSRTRFLPRCRGTHARNIGVVEAASEDQRTHADGMSHSHSAQTRLMWNL
jgi:hypothetical protein